MSGLTRKIRTDEKGVSPVIGVILMVAITVILAAVIASFVFGMGSKVQAAPQAQLMLEDNADMVSSDDKSDKIFDIKHYGGDTLKCEELKIVVSKVGGSTYTLTWDGTDSFDTSEVDGSTSNQGPTIQVTDKLISVGDTVTLAEDGSTDVTGDGPQTWTIQIIHIPTNTIIYEGEVLVQ